VHFENQSAEASSWTGQVMAEEWVVRGGADVAGASSMNHQSGKKNKDQDPIGNCCSKQRGDYGVASEQEGTVELMFNLIYHTMLFYIFRPPIVLYSLVYYLSCTSRRLDLGLKRADDGK